MNIDRFTQFSNGGDATLEITVEELLEVMNDFAAETVNSFSAKMNEKPSPKFITREEAMKMLKVTRVQTITVWEERGYLDPITDDNGRHIWYLQHDVFVLKNFIELLIVKPLKMKTNFFGDYLAKL